MNNIKGFTFYKSYYESLKNLKEKDKKDIINAMLEYVFEDKIPNFKGIKCTIWTLIQPNLNTSKRHSNENSGAPLGNQNAKKNKEKTDIEDSENNADKKQSKNNQKTINDLKDKDKDKELDKEKDKDKECVIETHAPISLSDLIDYGNEIGVNIEYCEKFYNTYESTGWINKNGQKITNAKSLLKKWMNEDKQKQQGNNIEDDYIDEAGFHYKNGRRAL